MTTEPSILNITNGDSTVDLLREAGIPGEYLPWRVRCYVNCRNIRTAVRVFPLPRKGH